MDNPILKKGRDRPKKINENNEHGIERLIADEIDTGSVRLIVYTMLNNNKHLGVAAGLDKEGCTVT